MTDGTLAVRRRDPKTSETSAQEAKQSALASGSYEYFAEMETIFGTGHIKKKGKNLPEVVGAVDEVKIESRRREKLKAFDRHLKAFKYSAALDSGIGKVCLFFSFFSPRLLSALPSLGGSSPYPVCTSDWQEHTLINSECPTINHLRSHPRAHPSRWTPGSTFREGRSDAGTGPLVLVETHYRPTIRRNGLISGRRHYRYVLPYHPPSPPPGFT